MKYYDSLNNFFIADSEFDPLSNLDTNEEKIKDTLTRYIISASGWRSVFAQSGDEEDPTDKITDENKVLITMIAKAFFEDLNLAHPHILLGLDARPTGTILGAIFLQTLVSLGAKVDYLFISAAPETMAYSNAGFDAFAYISASHNPVGHNGFKFGINGGVYAKERADVLAAKFRASLENDPISQAKEIFKKDVKKEMDEVLSKVDANKQKALAYYKDFILRTAGVDETFKAPLGIVAELNGSARGSSIDKSFLTSIGAKVYALNDKPRQIVHAIVPEAENLELCRTELEKKHKEDKDFILGYCPDNDGDRGNFVYITDEGKAEILQAQEVFALVVAIELADNAKKGIQGQAVAVNGPTSMRIDEIATRFGAKVFRAEVGEANVVNLAQSLRDKGYFVHILGEGSNGGNITDPAKVRDPLNSVMTFLKFLANKDLFAYMMEKLGSSNTNLSLGSLLKALPTFTTTGAFSTVAKMHVKHTDYANLKTKYEEALKASFPPTCLKGTDIVSFEVRQTEGIVERIGMGPEFRTGLCKGGLKVLFKDKDDKAAGFMWFRPSGTEPVLRVLVDLKGDRQALHDALIDYQRELVTEADR